MSISGKLADDIISCRPGVGADGVRLITLVVPLVVVVPTKQSHPEKFPASKSIFGGHDWENPDTEHIMKNNAKNTFISVGLNSFGKAFTK